MATYLFSALTNNQTIAFDPLNDVLLFDTAIRPAELLINSTGSGVQFAAGGKSITLSGITLDDLGVSSVTAAQNVQFSVPGVLLVGEGTTAHNGDLANNIVGGAGDDALLGLGGADVIDGGAGGDLMVGGLGDDLYKVDSAADIVTEENNSVAGAGVDTVEASVTYTLTSYVENLTLVGATAINGTGNTLANILTGNGADNILDGKTGADTMIGGDGNDTYFVDNTADVVKETNANKTQIDTVSSSITYTLGTLVENLVLTGTAALVGVGNHRDNQMTGNTGANTLNGKAGADTMTGGDGNDTYFVDNAGDVVTETNNSATQIDMVASFINYTLGANVENLRLIGEGTVNGTGNGLNNIIYASAGNNVIDGQGGTDTASYASVSLLSLVSGNPGTATTTYSATLGVIVDLSIVGQQDTVGSGFDTLTGIENLTGSGFSDELTGNINNNVLDGGAGTDLLVGGNGNDTYAVDGADVVVEQAAQGLDTVQSSVSYRLTSNVEYLTLTGTAAEGIGNSLDNKLTGNNSANFLDGRAGADKMDGGSGNDTYVVDNLGDDVTDSAGLDLVMSYINYTLGGTIESLRLMGQSALNGTGNALNNIIGANIGDNVLDGGTSATSGDTLSYEFGASSGVTMDLAVTTAQATGGSGTDTVTGFENLTGSDYSDFLAGDSGTNVLDGLGGTDTVSYASASKAVTIDLAGQTAETEVGGVTIIDTVKSFENIVGSGFNDTMTGTLGANVFDGGSAGIDTVTYQNVNPDEGGVVVDLTIAGTQDTIASGFDTLIGIENLTGSANDDILIGDALSNALKGGGGNDWLRGGSGDADELTGNGGKDTFYFAKLADSADLARDIITDFEINTDKIDLSAIDAKPSSAADNAFTFLGVAATFTASGQMRLEQSGTDTIVYFNTNGNTTNSEMTIVLQDTTAASFDAADFIL